MIVLFDHHAGIGGGQVVLADMCKQFAAISEVLVAVPAALAEALWPDRLSRPTTVGLANPWRDIAAELTSNVGQVGPNGCWILFANTYPAVLAVLRTKRHLQRLGEPVVTVAVMHSYPGSRLRRFVIRYLLARVDHRVPVEPGLDAIASDVESMPILVAPNGELPPVSSCNRTNVVKSYARSDPSKGLHLLAEVFQECERDGGLTCRVAVSQGLESRLRYTSGVIRALAPWLEEGRRSSAWIQCGDIFVLASVYGEAVSLTVQEAMFRGAFVIAPRLGAIPLLGSAAGGVAIYSPGDTAQMADAIRRAAVMPEDEFERRCMQNRNDIMARSGQWYAHLETLAMAWTTRHA